MFISQAGKKWQQFLVNFSRPLSLAFHLLFLFAFVLFLFIFSFWLDIAFSSHGSLISSRDNDHKCIFDNQTLIFLWFCDKVYNSICYFELESCYAVLCCAIPCHSTVPTFAWQPQQAFRRSAFYFIIYCLPQPSSLPLSTPSAVFAEVNNCCPFK